MDNYYTDEKNAQVIIALLKEHGIKKVIASPGTTNMPIVGSIQNDPFFEIYSSVDERSAAYIACGLAAESGEPVVLSCTGATASRNYMPGLTEAFYRKLPVLAITSVQDTAKVGHHIAQVIDRSVLPNDVVNLSVELPIVKDNDDVWNCEIKVNKAIATLRSNGGGPVHINLPTKYSTNYGVKDLPKYRIINQLSLKDTLPTLPKGRIGVFVGSHSTMSKNLTESINNFCKNNNAVVFCDHTSGYYGKYKVLYSLVASQKQLMHLTCNPDIIIHIGEVSGDYYSLSIKGKKVWRISEDGEMRDTFRKLRYIFKMSEEDFFNHYADQIVAEKNTYFHECCDMLAEVRNRMKEQPLSNIWLASQMASQIPEGATIHFAILNSLRSWNFFELPKSVTSASNVGGFGIDGGLSTLFGASLSNPQKLYFGVIGDLAFFYDINVIGNKNIGSNLRILLVNNGKGVEFRHKSHPADNFGEQADDFVAAGGHFGNKNENLVKGYATSLGFEYFSASNKEEVLKTIPKFLSTATKEKSIIFEVFTESTDEVTALVNTMNIVDNVKGKAKQVAKQVLNKKSFNVLKGMMKK